MTLTHDISITLKRLVRFVARFPNRLIHYFETGDLIPLMIVVSIPHYIGALDGHDVLYVAVAIALAVDVGQYRLVKAALKYGGNWWYAAGAVTLLSFFFHLEYYGGWTWDAFVRAAPLPFLIIILAALSVKENWARKTAPKNDNAIDTPTARHDTRRAENKSANDANDAPAARHTYQEFKLAQLARNGAGPMNVNQVMAQFHVPKRTAYRWLSQYRDEVTAEHVTEH